MIHALIIQLIPVICPVVIAIVIGFIWVRRGHEFDVPFTANLIHNVGIPCMVFSTLTKVDINPIGFIAMSWASLATHIAFGILGSIILGITRLPLRVYLNGLIFPNAANIGLPLCFFAFGNEGLALSIAWFMVDAILVSTLGIWIASGNFSIRTLLSTPILYATVGAGGFLISGIDPPDWLANTTNLIGGLAIPLLLLMMGVALATLKVPNLNRALFLSFLRLGIGFFVGNVASSVFGFVGIDRGVLIINCALSVGMINYLLSQYYDQEPQEVAAMVVVSGFVSLATLPLLLAYLL